jgi:hypothetical protein
LGEAVLAVPDASFMSLWAAQLVELRLSTAGARCSFSEECQKFNDDFGNQLDTFFKEIGRSSPNKQALREAVFAVKSTLRRQVHHVEDTLGKAKLEKPMHQLLSMLDGLQLAVARKLRDAIDINGSLD